MVSSRNQTTSLKNTPRSRRRANPMGLGRLLILVLTVGLLSMGQGLIWWTGLLLLGLILLAVSRQGAWWSPWSASIGFMSLAFWHQGVIAPWTAILAMAVSGTGFLLGLLRSRPG